MIFFHDIPEKLVEEKEAEAVAREIIKIEPDNCVANRILKNKNKRPIKTVPFGLTANLQQ